MKTKGKKKRFAMTHWRSSKKGYSCILGRVWTYYVLSTGVQKGRLEKQLKSEKAVFGGKVIYLCTFSMFICGFCIYTCLPYVTYQAVFHIFHVARRSFVHLLL